jgi:hypothetical protein
VGAVLAARVVEAVLLARMWAAVERKIAQISSSGNRGRVVCVEGKIAAPMLSKHGSSAGSSSGMVSFWMLGVPLRWIAWIATFALDRVHELGQRVNSRVSSDQSMVGLWRHSQSVPTMMSSSPMLAT